MGNSASDLVLSRMIRDYVDWSNVQENTKARAREAINHLIAFCGDIPAAEVRKMHVVRFQTYLRDRVHRSGNGWKAPKPGLALSTVNSICSTVSQVYSWYVKQELLETNPFIGAGRLKVPKRQIRYYKQDAIEALLDAASRTVFKDPTANLRWTTAILCGLHGMRAGEVQNLRWDDIDLENGTIKVAYRDDKPGHFWAWHDKGKDERTIGVSQTLLECLYRLEIVCTWRYPLLKRCTCLRLLSRIGHLTEEQRKRPYQNWRREWRRIKAVAKIEGPGTFHDLRKTAGTHLNRQGVPLATAQQILGHKNLQTTRDIYTAVEREHCVAVGRKAFNAYTTNQG